jgi:hypothetical protein
MISETEFTILVAAPTPNKTLIVCAGAHCFSKGKVYDSTLDRRDDLREGIFSKNTTAPDK